LSGSSGRDLPLRRDDEGLRLLEMHRHRHWHGKSIPEGENCVDEDDAGLEEQDQDEKDEDGCWDIHASSSLWVAGKDLRRELRWRRWWRLRLEVLGRELWWVKSVVLVVFKLFVEVSLEGLLERHLSIDGWCLRICRSRCRRSC